MDSDGNVKNQLPLYRVLRSLRSPIKSLYTSRELVISLVRREIRSRFAGTFLGLAWSVLAPLVMLLIYAFVFGVVFQARWGHGSEQNLANFAVVIFCSISAFNIFQECLLRAPMAVVSQPNLVKKVVFPTETLVLSLMGAALFQGVINFALVIFANYLVTHTFHWTVVFLPLILLPLIFLTLGMGWLLASLGVFFRDIQQMVGLLANALLFLTPIFFSLEALPNSLKTFAMLNPLAIIVEAVRKVVLWGVIPDLWPLFVCFVFSWCVMQFGYAVFMRTKPAFADVI